jgi:hypothetical protein
MNAAAARLAISRIGQIAINVQDLDRRHRILSGHSWSALSILCRKTDLLRLRRSAPYAGPPGKTRPLIVSS